MSELKYKVGDRFEDDSNTRWFVTILRVNEKDYTVEFNDCEKSVEDVDDKWLDGNFKIIEEPSKQIGGEHYSKLKIDPYEYSMVNGLNPLQMNAIKYITRYKDKNGVEDLKKSIHTINRLIEFESK